MFERPLRIALYTYATQPRGGVAHTIELGNALHDLGHDVVLHALDEGGGFFRTPRCSIRTIAVAAHGGDITSFVRARIAAYVTELDADTREEKPFDIHHAHDGISGSALATLAERGRIAGFVRTVHHADDFRDPVLAAIQARSIVAARACYVVSDCWRDDVRARFGMDATRVTNGVDAVRFVPADGAERARTRRRFGLAGEPLLLSIGGIEARKNTLGTLEAFARVRERRPNAQLVIAGGASVFDHSSYRRAFAARAEELGLELGSSVIVLGVVADAEMPRLVAASDALVFPSLTEGFGLVVLEALACDIAVITSAIAPFTEYLTDREAELVDPHASEAIAAGILAALEPATRARRIAAGRAVVERYAWATSARTHVARYEETIGAGNTVRGALAR